MKNKTHTCKICDGEPACRICGKKTDTPFHTCDRSARPAATGIELEVCRDIAARQAVGIKKYGQTVANNPLHLKDWLNHAYTECLDQAVYLKRAISELEK